jgi:hypothetical protein
MIKKLKEIFRYHYQIGLLVWLSEIIEPFKVAMDFTIYNNIQTRKVLIEKFK